MIRYFLESKTKDDKYFHVDSVFTDLERAINWMIVFRLDWRIYRIVMNLSTGETQEIVRIFFKSGEWFVEENEEFVLV